MAKLNGIWIKIQRARKHIEELRSLVQDYLESEPFTLFKTVKENGDLVYRVRIEEENST